MAHILVTGGTGQLGRAVVQQLEVAGHRIRIMSRKAQAVQDTIEFVQADLATGIGLREAVTGVDIIIHAASSPMRDTAIIDVQGTQRLTEHARTAGVTHVLYISIVGVDRIPYAYYQHKLAAEGIIQHGGIPWSIQRITQFHSFADMLLQQAMGLPLFVLPTDLRIQPIDVGDAAQQVCRVAVDGARGMLPDIGGPQIFTVGELARIWLASRGLRRRIIHLPLPGALAAAFRRGEHTTRNALSGGVSWSAWLQHTYRESSTEN